MKFYETPELELTVFKSEDVITISIAVGDDGDVEATVSAW